MVGCYIKEGMLFILDDGVFCIIDLCDEDNDLIVNKLNDFVCDDGLYCIGIELCDVFNGCVSVFIIILDGIECIIDICDEVNKMVIYIVNYVFCVDGVFCNGVEVCDLNNGDV